MLKTFVTQVVILAIATVGFMCTDDRYYKANWIFGIIEAIMAVMLAIEIVAGVMWGIWATDWI